MRVAFLTNASPASGVGYYATHLKRALLAADPTLEIDEYMIDGTAGVIRRNDQVVATINVWAGLLGAKTINWIRLRPSLQTQLIEAGMYDIYHATNQTLSYVVDPHQPWIVTVHDIIELTQPQTLMGRLIASYLYSGIHKAKQLLTVSNYTAQQVRQAYRDFKRPITVTPNGVGKPFTYIPNFKQSSLYTQLLQELHIPDKSPKILCVGSNHPRKNVPLALRAFAKIQAKHPEALFIKVGSPGIAPGQLVMRDLIAELKITDSVKVISDTANISDDMLAQLYNAADVLIFPSKLEGFGLPLLQAMACGLPVVASNATSIPEVVGEAALLQAPDDVDSFVKNIERILSEPSLRQSLHQKGLTRAQQFAWPSVAAKTLDVYKQIQV